MAAKLGRLGKEQETSEEHKSSQGGLTLRGDDRRRRLEAGNFAVKCGGGAGWKKQRKGKNNGLGAAFLILQIDSSSPFIDQEEGVRYKSADRTS